MEVRAKKSNKTATRIHLIQLWKATPKGWMLKHKNKNYTSLIPNIWDFKKANRQKGRFLEKINERNKRKVLSVEDKAMWRTLGPNPIKF